MGFDIISLYEQTTIKKVNCKAHKTILGDENYISRFQRDQGQQTDLNYLRQNWDNKFKSFVALWNEERQNYRRLWDTFDLFYYNFEQLRFNKVACIKESFRNEFKSYHLNKLTGVSLYGMYHHGKKCIDILKSLDLINKQHPDWDYCKKYSETRNKLIEHNHNPRGFNLQIDPSILSLASTDSLLEVHIHELGVERAFIAYVDYYEDYYRLEKIIVDIIKGF
jgi:hypothetical protein